MDRIPQVVRDLDRDGTAHVVVFGEWLAIQWPDGACLVGYLSQREPPAYIPPRNAEEGT